MPGANHTKIPLDGLFARLRLEGFEITTSAILDVQKVLVNLDDDAAGDPANLTLLLGPLICRNKEEQEKFYKICTAYFESIEEQVRSITPIQQPKKPWWPWAAAAALVVALVFFLTLRPSPAKIQPTVIITNSAGQTTGFVKGDTLSFAAANVDSSFLDQLRYDWTINSKKIDSPAFSQTFSDAGTFNYSLTVSGTGNKVISEPVQGSFLINCERPPAVSILREQTGDQQLLYRAQVENPSAQSSMYRYHWFVNESPESTAPEFTPDTRYEAPYTVRLKIDFPPEVHCSTDSLSDSYIESPDLSMSVNGTVPLTLNKKIDAANLTWILAGLLIPLLGSIATYVIIKRKRKNQKAESRAQEVKTATDDIEKSYAGPYTLRFNTNDEKIAAEAGVGQLAEILRKRHTSEHFQLNVFKTIKKTIRAGGFPSLQFSAKTQPTDFLILLDKEHPDGHTTRLFSWLIAQLKKEEVAYTLYSFYKEPQFFNNETLNHRMIPADKLARLYPESIVLIFTPANGFFKSHHPTIKNWIIEKFRNWETKLLITPVSKNDWGARELALYQAGFAVIPADLNAQQVIADEINFMIDKNRLKKTIVPDSYSSKRHSFNRWNHLQAYITTAVKETTARTQHSPARLQTLITNWVCATAIYPYVNWDITVGIGKALEKKYCTPGELVNYTNLLILSRIQWMNDGDLSDSLRREMLLRLDKNSEAVARQAILAALKDIEPSIKADSAVAAEFVYLQTTNKFLLNSYKREDFNLSQTEYDRMKDYAESDRLDWVLDEYLAVPNTNSILQHPETSAPASLDELFKFYKNRDKESDQQKQREAAEEAKRRKAAETKRRLLDIGKVAATFLLLAIPAFILLYSNNVYARLYKPATATINFLLSPEATALSGTGTELQINIDTATYQAIRTSDSSFQITNLDLQNAVVPTTVVLQTSTGNFNSEIDTLFAVNRLHVEGAKAKPRLSVRYNIATESVNSALKALSEYYNVTAIQTSTTENTRLIYYYREGKPRADSIVNILKQSLTLDVPIEFIPENRTPPAPPILFLFSQNGVEACAAIPINTVPASIAEIWSGITNNRLITFDLPRRVIYYSTGEPTTYGTYRIEKVCQSGGVLKVITKANDRYKVFFAQNLQRASFDLAVCQQEFSSAAAADTAVRCESFYAMRLYYGKDQDVIYVPVDARNYTTAQIARRKNLTEPQSNNNVGGSLPIDSITVHINNFSGNTIGGRYTAIEKGSNLSAFDQAIWSSRAFAGGPFDRDYLSISIAKGRGEDPPVQQVDNCATVYYSMKEALSVGIDKVCKLNLTRENLTSLPPELSKFVNLQELNLGEISFDEKEVLALQDALSSCKIIYTVKTKTDSEIIIAGLVLEKERLSNTQEKFLRELAQVMKENPSVTLSLTVRMSGKMNQKIADARITTVTNVLRKAGVDVSRLTPEVGFTRSIEPPKGNTDDLSVSMNQLDKVVIRSTGLDEVTIRMLKSHLNPKAAY
ncbi:MAG: hypothetical protein H7Y31_14310 [Chitinophagaceae bacterium]|nr:hypothetical protein [Chitinophagaceae bacterium]